ncbi:hypothetical protein DX933_10650 [Ornithinibacillus gellani]|uniref:sporulation protein YpjB n=1 Tax=Ornithinibacillus gellani TaxID=2293253 RepID=UPI000F49115B|nr:sporulation protein YpjB [Ornithinibacillus gellani]TQS74402.1 hypothetical protein DX933_10650 [Ornithinibacillus gellani]
MRMNIWNKIRTFHTWIIMILLIISLLYPTEIFAAVESAKTNSKQMDMAPFLWIIVIVGGCIGLTLSYVSWRKYKGEQKKFEQENKNVD